MDGGGEEEKKHRMEMMKVEIFGYVARVSSGCDFFVFAGKGLFPFFV